MRSSLYVICLLYVFLGWTDGGKFTFSQNKNKKKKIAYKDKTKDLRKPFLLSSRRKTLSSQSAIVITMCENGGKTASARFIEGMGKVALAPFVRPFYRKRIWLIGRKATRKGFLSAIRKAAKNNKVVDVLLFAHGSPKYTKFADGYLSYKDLIKGLKGRGGKKIRMVYTTTCYSKHNFISAWKKVGAKAVRGAKGVNRPLDFPRFFLGWLYGETYENACRRGFMWNKRIHKVFNRVHRPMKKIITTSRKIVKKIHPRTKNGRKLKRNLLSFIHLFYRWFKKPWKIEDSRPYFSGGNMRIDKIPSLKKHK